MWVGADTMENSSKVLQKVKTRTTSISIFGNISEEIENTINNEDEWLGRLGLIHKEYLKSMVEEKQTEPLFDKLSYWLAANDFCEFCYFKLLDCGSLAEDARGILPLDINTEFAMTAFVSDWKHFFDLRADATTGKPHPDINRIAVPLKEEFIKNGYLK